MENENINTPAEILKDKILKSSGLKGLQPLQDKQKKAAEKAAELRSKVVSLEEDVRRFTIQFDELQVLDSGANPEAAKKISSLKAQIGEANELKILVEAELGKNEIEHWEVNDQVLYIARLALERYRAKITGELIDRLIDITIVPQIWNAAVALLGEKIPGLAGLPPEVRTMSYIGPKPIGCEID